MTDTTQILCDLDRALEQALAADDAAGAARIRKRIAYYESGGAPEMEPRFRAPGGGRRPLYGEPMEDRMVRLPAEAIADLTELGDGNLSAGVRLLWERWNV